MREICANKESHANDSESSTSDFSSWTESSSIPAILLEKQAEFGDQTYFCKVRWLSCGKMSHGAHAFREEIVTFLESKNEDVSHFCDPL